MIPFEDKNARYRFFGVVVWFMLFMWFVPDWYASPVNFVPKETVIEEGENGHGNRVLFSEVYRLPNKISSDQELAQAKQQAQQLADQDALLRAQAESNDLDDMSAKNENLLQDQNEGEEPALSSQTHEDENKSGNWLLLIASYQDQARAQNLKQKLEGLGQSAAVKFYPEQKVYSVRVIDVESKAKAKTLQQKLDKMFNLNDSIIRYSE